MGKCGLSRTGPYGGGAMSEPPILTDKSLEAVLAYENACREQFQEAFRYVDEDQLPEWTERWANARDLVKAVSDYLRRGEIANV